MNFPFWVWFALAGKVQSGKLHHTDRHGAPDLSKPPYNFGDVVYVPKTYWDGGPWIVSHFTRISADDPVHKGRARLWVWFYSQGLVGRSYGFRMPRRWFPKPFGLAWRWDQLRNRFELSPIDALQVIQIEEATDISYEALRQRVARERKTIQEILEASPRANAPSNLVFDEWKLLVKMGLAGKQARLPLEADPIWPPQIGDIARRVALEGGLFRVPATPPACHKLTGKSADFCPSPAN
ncbi:hypothetical protein GF359_05090 [candidate division WOR-3 bacterium]|uniref:Uncharacterized protein n=1 Tax=candidate division WOR-3 bacterium TaxID=2052148 RepID=A0A9D5QD14_UNCW3|nr:hypothetical protein [candidate division WOR-3 bacterium]MBD3364571.1 hypothetical protein [candidate division WOR-3 bacterium]